MYFTELPGVNFNRNFNFSQTPLVKMDKIFLESTSSRCSRLDLYNLQFTVLEAEMSEVPLTVDV